MNIGSLKHRIDIETPTKTSNGMGGFSVVWGALATATAISAAIWPVSASETVQAGQNMGVITHKIRIRYRAGIKASWRIKFGTRYFNIIGPPINVNEENKILDLLCKEAS